MIASLAARPAGRGQPVAGALDRVAGVLAAADLQLRRDPDGRRRPLRVRRARAPCTRCSRRRRPRRRVPAPGRRRRRAARRLEMKRILVVANETVAGKPLIDAVKRARRGRRGRGARDLPAEPAPHGYVIYDDDVRDAAENRLEMTLALLREAGIEADGEVMDPDPYAAIMDALGEQDYDEIIISTHPETRSGWLRQGLVDRVAARQRPPGRARGGRPRRRARRRQAHARGGQPDRRRPELLDDAAGARRRRSRAASS